MNDPSYVRAEIDANPAWRLAFWLSEVDNDNAPIGWSRYIALAQSLLAKFTMQERPVDPREEPPA
jgi:hypothetical protein